MSKKWIITTACTILLISSLLIAYTADLFGGHSPENKSPSAEIITTYQEAIAKSVNKNQKEAIAKLQENNPLYQERAVKMILGDLPKDSPRITEKQVKDIVARVASEKSAGADDKSGIIMEEFNRIHGAPDYVGGSGMYRTIYLLSENPPTTVIFMEGSVTLRVLDPEHPDKPMDVDLLKNETIIPQPTTSPNK